MNQVNLIHVRQCLQGSQCTCPGGIQCPARLVFPEGDKMRCEFEPHADGIHESEDWGWTDGSNGMTTVVEDDR